MKIFFKKIFQVATLVMFGLSSTACAEQTENTKDRDEHHVLCLGNSITRHTPYDAVNWYSDHGMAASKPENDYCHVLESLMRQDNKNTTVTPCAIPNWERDFSLNLDELVGPYIKGKDIVVIRLGENVPAEKEPLFDEALSELIEYCKQYTDRIVLTGQYWPSDRKEKAVKKNAEKYGLPYVRLNWIWLEHQEECCPKEGDIIYDTQGNPYPIVGEFIITHPNDKGMEYIAKAIYEKI
jgi:alpha-galactosidase